MVTFDETISVIVVMTSGIAANEIQKSSNTLTMPMFICEVLVL